MAVEELSTEHLRARGPPAAKLRASVLLAALALVAVAGNVRERTPTEANDDVYLIEEGT